MSQSLQMPGRGVLVKGLMEVMTERGLTTDWITKLMKTREYVLQNFWEYHLLDKFGRRAEIPPKTLAVPKSVFSYGMTIMDKVDGWNEEQ